ncbi:MAG: hypothetical protein HYZ51_04755 [Candidatus Doudnabacteria bacterium]|nr:hypothetical protein [Candidatus Doudnabacteria bacterium]
MADTPGQQFFNHLNQAKKILIALPRQFSVDAAGASVAVALFVQRLGKEAEILTSGKFFEQFPFLPKFAGLKQSLNTSESLAVVVDTSKKLLEEISYSKEADRVKIFLKGKNEVFVPEELSFEINQKPLYDLAIIVGAQSLEDLGQDFEQNPNVFYETVKVNIDNHPGNKQFGSINLVDINACSVSEVVAQVLAEYETDLLNEDIATSLLAGIMAKTNSFQHPQVTPNSFLRASRLIEKGARQQEIVRALFKTRSLPLLKLWGRALARLSSTSDWALSVLTSLDFEKSGADVSLLPLVLKDLLEHLGNKMLILILAENGQGSKLVFAARYGLDISELFQAFGASEKLASLVSSPFEAFQLELPELAAVAAEAKLMETLYKLPPKFS